MTNEKEKGRSIHVFKSQEDAEYFFRNLKNLEYANRSKTEDRKDKPQDQYWWSDQSRFEATYFEQDVLKRGGEGKIFDPYFEVIKNKYDMLLDVEYICVRFPTFETDPEPYGILVGYSERKFRNEIRIIFQ